jgi:hypothetical protein
MKRAGYSNFTASLNILTHSFSEEDFIILRLQGVAIYKLFLRFIHSSKRLWSMALEKTVNFSCFHVHP